MNESLDALTVDDDVSIQNFVEKILSDGGFEPKAASSLEEAIALLNAHRFPQSSSIFHLEAVM